MEVANITYRAKDGKLFLDPLECEEYEKTIGILPGSVGALIADLEKLKPTMYIHGVVLVREKEANKDESAIYTRTTMCCDSLLEDYVNVNNLTEEQRYMSETVGCFIKELKKTNKDYPCQYMLAFSHNISMVPAGVMSNYNISAWRSEDKKQNNL